MISDTKITYQLSITGEEDVLLHIAKGQSQSYLIALASSYIPVLPNWERKISVGYNLFSNKADATCVHNPPASPQNNKRENCLNLRKLRFCTVM